MRLVDKVIADLQELRDDWHKEITENRLRNDSVKLRRLLADGEKDVTKSDLHKAWYADGHSEPMAIQTLTRQLGASAFSRSPTRWVGTGGATINNGGIITMGPTIANDRYFPAPVPVTVSLEEFIRGDVAVAMGRRISRARLVRYVANKLGGAHWDEERDANWQSADFRALDATMEGTEFFGRSPVMYELLSIGQHLVTSKDIANWIA